MTDKLLKDAIADANLVKSVALESARERLEESFRPQLMSMLSTRLREMEDNTSGDAYGTEDGGEDCDSATLDGPKDAVAMGKGDARPAVKEQNTLDTSGIGTADNKEPSKAAHDSSDIENPGQEVDEFGKGGLKKPVGEAVDGAFANGDGHEKVIDQLKEDDGEFDLGNQDNHTSFGDQDQHGHSPFGNEGSDDQDATLDLEAIIRELEADVYGAEGNPADQSAMAPDANPAATHQIAEPPSSIPPAGDDTDDNVEKENLHFESADENSDDEELEEMLREMEAEDDDYDKKEKYEATITKLHTENVALKQKLKEHRDVITFIKGRMNESTMLNTKLLFTNKLFKQFNLNEGQKLHIIETFDRATTPREVKLVFATLAEAYKGKTAPVSKAVKNITESMKVASKAVGSTKPKNEKILNEEAADALALRFQKIAGIIKS